MPPTPPRSTRLRRAESGAVAAVQRRTRAPWAVRGAQGLSAFGDHAAGWLALGALGAAIDDERRSAWVRASAGVLGAHASTVVVKRVLRRARPATHPSELLVGGRSSGREGGAGSTGRPAITVHATTPGRLSFPSSHAASSTAAALAYGRLLAGRGGGLAAVGVIAPVMGLSRLVLGLHFPTDVAVGTAVGAAFGRWAAATPAHPGRGTAARTEVGAGAGPVGGTA